MENSNRILFVKGNGGLAKIHVQTAVSEAEIYLHGAHVTHFQRKGEAPLLFLSDKSHFENDQPIRGGVPVIFPWFGAKEGKPMHGFARTQNWELKEIVQNSCAVDLHFSLPISTEAAEFPPFTAEYFVSVGEALALELKVTNRSSEEFAFENCLHTYFSIGDIHGVSVSGLKGVDYLDKVEGFARKKETNAQIKFSGETDRVYVKTRDTTEIHDAGLSRKIIIEKGGSNSTVVWNPWIAKAKAMADFGDDEYLRMVCVESGNVSENSLVLSPGQSASLAVKLHSEFIS